MNYPNFFIIGAAKSGTTALAQYLAEHENVFMSNPKEPHYYSEDMPGYKLVKDYREYTDLFSEANKLHTAVGEASVYYLYSTVAIKKIYEYKKDAKIIVMLRNPVEMVYSLHSQLIQSGNENILDFEKAWEIIDHRKKGKSIPKGCSDSKVLNYKDVAKYGDQLERVYQYFPRNKVKVILFDDFKRNTSKVYKDVLEFIQVEPDGRKEFPVINPNTRPRSVFIKGIIKNQGVMLTLLKKTIKKMLNVKALGIASAIDRLNTKEVAREALSQDMQERIVSEYSEDIKKLSKIIDVNLEHWLLFEQK